MANLTFKQNPITTNGNLPNIGEKAPDFSLIDTNLAEISLANFVGKKIIFNIFPSIDTPVCASQLKTFNKEIARFDNVILLFASLDLPFAYNRFCAAEGIDNTVTTSDYRHHSLAKNYGVMMNDGALAGLYARAVLVLDENHHVTYCELVHEVTDEPDYNAALAHIK